MKRKNTAKRNAGLPAGKSPARNAALPAAAGKSSAASRPANRPHVTPASPPAFTFTKFVSATSLEEAVAQFLLGILSESPEWKKLQAETGADAAAIEAALRSPGVRQRLEEMAVASLVLQTAVFLPQLEDAVQEKESWACKLLLELTGLAPRLAAAFASGGEPAAAVLDADLDRAAVAHLRELFLCPPRGTAGSGSAPPDTPGSASPEES